MLAEDLFVWSKYSNFSAYKQKVLKQLNSANLVEYDRETDSVTLSPLRVKRVEEQILRRKIGVTSNPSLRRMRRERRAA